MLAPRKKSHNKRRQHIKIPRHHFANKGPSSHILMLKLELQYFDHLMRRADSFEKTLMLGKIEGNDKGTTEDEMAGWHHRLNGHEFE